MSAERSRIKRSMLLPEDDDTVGDEKYSARKIRNLAKEHIIAIVANKVVGGKTIATVYDLNGKEIGPLSELSTVGVPLHLNGIFMPRPESKELNFKVKTYIPDLDKIDEVTGYIYSESAMGERQVKTKKK